MSKYVIDLRPDCKVVQEICESDGQVSIGARSIEYLEELNTDYVNEHFGDLQDTAYQKGYDAGIIASSFVDTSDEAYQRGLNDAWDAARKIVTWPDRSLVNSDTFDLDPGENIFTKYSASEAIERLKSYEDDKIKRGDIVNVKRSCKDELLGVVTKVWEDNCYIMWGDGSGGAWSKDSVVKTGKHIDVDKFLEEIAT